MRYSKSWTEALQEVQEQVGVRKVDFVDGITPDLQEAKPEFEVKYASSKKGPIKVSKFMSLKDAKKFLAQVKGEGMNGIISQNGKPVKEEKIECPKCKGEGCEHCDGKGYHMKEHCGECGAMDHVDEKMDGRKKFSGKQAKKDNEDRRAAQRKKLGILGPNEETINEADYELYHKDFSSAMQHAYAHAKKKGFTVDPEEIDNKVATGPRKPSKGKTNRYILGTDKKQKLHVQVANLDNKRYELNMYIEETEMNEKKLDPVGQADADIDNDGDVDSSDKYLKNRRKKISQAIKKDESKLYSHVKSMMKKEYANIKKMKKMNSEDYLDMWLNDEIELSEDFNQEVVELTQLHDEGKLTDAELEEGILRKVGGAVARGVGRVAKAGAKVAGKAAVAGAKAGGKLAVKGAKAGAKRMSTQGRIDAAKKKADKFKKKSAQRKELKKVKKDAATAQRRFKAGK
tara:strand:+ start:2030 stop:3400 length:1371 start_codon:yes stop_codon:yes gene_type:complete